MRRHLLIFLFSFYPFILWSQISETFEDGDFTNNPEWIGDTAFFRVRQGMLNSNFQGIDNKFQAHFSLSTKSSSVKSTVWKFWVKTKTTSSNNFIRIFLTSQKKRPRPDTVDYGYFVEVGGLSDQVILYKKDRLNKTKLIESATHITDGKEMKIKVICNADYQWQLFTDNSGSGKEYSLAGAASDSSFPSSQYFGIEIFQRGKTLSQTHWFDDITVHTYFPDTLPPTLNQLFVEDSQHLRLDFSEPLLKKQITTQNFFLKSQNPESLTFSRGNASIELGFSQAFQEKTPYSLNIKDLPDLSKNQLDTTGRFVYYLPQKQDIVISEIYPDPKNSHGLPPAEFLELYNKSEYPINLTGWKICDKVRCATFPNYLLKKDSLLIVCSPKKVADFSTYGSVIGVSQFPSLNNGNETLSLKNKKGNLIHQVHYTKETYGNRNKSNGGWSLEMQYPQHPCLVTGNWTASHADIGGSPGQISSPGSPPSILLTHLTVEDSLHLGLQLNISTDKASLNKARFTLNKHNIKQILLYSSQFQSGYLQIILEKPLQKSKRYILQISGLKNCGLQSKKKLQTSFVIPEEAVKGDLYFNEILFNPLKRGAEFIEIYNNSNKVIDLSLLYLANKRQGEWYQTYPASPTSYYLFPGEYVAITKDKTYLLQQYSPKFPDHILEVDHLPSLPNAAGNAYLLGVSKQLLDHFSYTAKDQSIILHNKKGVSLEKIYPTISSTSIDHWVSAASNYNFASPGYRNSQYQLPGSQNIHFEIKPKTFSPDHDGRKDVTFLTYSLPPGYSGKILIFNEQGIPVKHLRKNISLPTSGKIAWDGKDDKGKILPTGIYIFFIEIYHPKGETIHKKLPVVLVKKK